MKSAAADKQVTKPSIMWLISLSISSILVIITINVLSTSNNNNTVANGNFIFGNGNNKPTLRPTTHRRHSVLSRAAKQMKKITKDGIKLIDKKNIARCVHGVFLCFILCYGSCACITQLNHI